MQAKQEATSSSNQEQSDFVPIFMMKLPNCLHLDAIEGFQELLRTKVPGSWLIRESRVAGMISITFKRENGKVGHTRFAFIDDKWDIVNDDMRDKHTDGSSLINYEHVDRASVKSKYELLLEAINEMAKIPTFKFVFRSDHMIIPAIEQATKQRAYYVDTVSYVVSKQRAQKDLYMNLLKSLEEVKREIRDCIDALGKDGALQDKKMGCLNNIPLSYKKLELSHTLRNVSKPFKSNKDAREFKDLLDTWLEANSFKFDLMRPVLLTLIVEPYYVVETGMVYDAAALFHEDIHLGTKLLERCPLTQTKITYNPVHLEGYRRELYEALELFYDLVQLHQMKTGVIKEKQDDLSSLPLLSIFAPPQNETNEASQGPSNIFS